MSRSIREIMNGELLVVMPETPVEAIREAFPHWDTRTQSSWTDEWPLDDAHASASPDAAGVIEFAYGT